jgi:hypothetical protein
MLLAADLFSAIHAQNAAQVERLLTKDPSLVGVRDEEGSVGRLRLAGSAQERRLRPPHGGPRARWNPAPQSTADAVRDLRGLLQAAE